MTLVNDTFTQMPSGVVVNADRIEELFMTNSLMSLITGPAIVISDENNGRSQYNLTNVYCQSVPVLAASRDNSVQVKAPAGGLQYLVKNFTHGNQISDLGATPVHKTTADMETVAVVPPGHIPTWPRSPCA